ncbi:MAG: ABC-F family ATP-binding cassette domain-containing protein [Alphaproteobacteria bacterium]|nr:ABC-F family ATP-binding cassette domain-containing protein [Alphaproteobacteria bacterium]
MSFITLRQVGVSTPEPLFQNLSLTIGEGCRIGVVAGNGGGKTTLLRCIAGRAELSEGEITCSRGMRLGFVEQDVPAAFLDQTLFECLRTALPADEQADTWRVDVLLASFEVPEEFHHRVIRALSGGWQKLALIARAFAAEPDTLLLDEPTNHLDLSKIQFLERWLGENAGRMPMVIVSHDRRFLGACTTHTLFLRPKVSKLYAHAYSTARQLLVDDDAADQTKLEQDLKEANRLRRSANELKNIGINSGCDNALKKAKQVAARAAEIKNNLKEPHKERTGQIRLSSRDIHARVLLSLDDVIVRTPDGKALFKTGKLKVFQGDRVVLLGANGAGKSQLVKLIHRAFIDPANAEGVQFSPTVVVGYADQQMSQLPDHETPFDIITNRFRLGDQRSRTLLAGAGFPVDRQNCPIRTFSLGQKARLGMLVLRLTEPNFYLLDEPTNHVDIPGQEKLEAEILAQNATCLLVSHDRSFVNAIGTRFLQIENGKLLEQMEEK